MTGVYDGVRNYHLGAPGGYFGNALVVDVTDGSTTTLPLPERVLRDYLGGAGLGVWLMTELASSGVDPLDAAAVRSEERRVGKECRSRWSPYH